MTMGSSLESLTSSLGHSVVLASGGIDSSTILALLRTNGIPGSALFVDYGQASLEAEELAVKKMCRHLHLPLGVVRLRGTRFGPGEIRGRNAFLLHTALMAFPYSSGTIAVGLHAGVDYRDSTPDFIELMQRSFEFHTGGAISVLAPFIDWTKREILDLAFNLGVPVAETYSCEAGSVPCRQCRSCLERIALGLEGLCERA